MQDISHITILLTQGAKTRLVTCPEQSCMHLRCCQGKLCLTIYVTVHQYKTQVVILEWFAYFYYFEEISQIPLIDYLKQHIQNIQWKQGKSAGFDSCDRPSNLKLNSNRQFFSPRYLEIWWMTSKNNRALLLFYIKLCASFQIHRWIQTGVTVRKRSILVEIGDILSCVTLKLDGWPWKTIGHRFYTTLSFVYYFKAIGEFKLQLQSGNAQFGSKSAFFVPCDLEIWRMTLKNNRTPLLCYFKLCV